MASRRLLLLYRPQSATAAIATVLMGYHAASSSHLDTRSNEYSTIGGRYDTRLRNKKSWMNTAACEQRRQRTDEDGVRKRDIGLRDYLLGKVHRGSGGDHPESLERDAQDEDSSDAVQPVGGSSSEEEDDTPPIVPDLSPEESRLVRTFDRAAPAVAHVQTTAVVRADPFSLRAMEVPAGTGSGFVWDDEGHVVTNYHVIAAHGEAVTRVLVRCQGMAEPVDAEVVGLEPEKDIAVLKISAAAKRTHQPPSTERKWGRRGGKKVDEGRPSLILPRPLEVGTSSTLRVGQTVLAIGNPFGLDFTLTTGVVSALGRDVQSVTGRPIRNCIQTDASINAGNSGGPLLDSRGRLVGVNVAIYSPGGSMGGNVGIGFAIPVDTVRRVVEQIIRHGGTVARPRLGVDVADDRVASSLGAQLGRRLDGALVVEVAPHGPAARSGIRATRLRRDGTLVLGDLIVEVDGRPVREVEDLLTAVEERRDGEDREDGEAVKVRVHRGCDPSREETVTAHLDVGDGGGHWASRRGFGGGFQAA